MMNASSELFISQSRGFLEHLDWSKSLIAEPDEGVRQTVDNSKRRIEEVLELVMKGEVDLGVAEERRLKIERPAWDNIKKRVLDRWASKDGLGPVRAKYRKAVYGEELQPDLEEARHREEALRKFEAISFEIATLHHVSWDSPMTGKSVRRGKNHDNDNS